MFDVHKNSNNNTNIINLLKQKIKILDFILPFKMVKSSFGKFEALYILSSADNLVGYAPVVTHDGNFWL